MLESLKVMLLCGSDLLQSFCTPGVWIPEQVVNQRQHRYINRDFILSTLLTVVLFFSLIVFWKVKAICKDYGIVCIRREGQDVESMIFGDRILYETRVSTTEFLVSVSLDQLVNLLRFLVQDNIRIVNNFVPNQISSSRLR